MKFDKVSISKCTYTCCTIYLLIVAYQTNLDLFWNVISLILSWFTHSPMIKGLLNHLRKMHIIFSLLFVIPSTMAISIMDQDVNEVRSFNDINLNLCTKKSTIIWCVTIVRTFGGLMIIDTQMNLCSWSKYFTTWMMCNYFGIRRFANRKLLHKEPIILGKDDSQNLIHNSIFWLLCMNDTIMTIFSTWEWFLNGSTLIFIHQTLLLTDFGPDE